jgi:phosphomevalonate kinase
LTGAYAVLEGAPAVVAAVDRYAVADAAQWAERPSAEVEAALGRGPAPLVDVGPLHDGTGRKLGLGSSAAALVASLGALALSRGEDLRSPLVRAAIFRRARESHARAQLGGSGVDVAASVHGGVLRYIVGPAGDAAIRALELPSDLYLQVYDSGTSARTGELRARFDRLRARSASSRPITGLLDAAEQACRAIERRDARSFVSWAREFGGALAALGRLADAPIVPPRFAELATVAERENAAFLPSGAGGGDVAVWLGTAPPSAAFASHAEALSMRPLTLRVDREGLHPLPP